MDGTELAFIVPLGEVVPVLGRMGNALETSCPIFILRGSFHVIAYSYLSVACIFFRFLISTLALTYGPQVN
jgi:hypothetical protein